MFAAIGAASNQYQLSAAGFNLTLLPAASSASPWGSVSLHSNERKQAMSNEIAPAGLDQEWLDKLAQAAKEQAATEKPTGNFFSTKGVVLSRNQMALPGNKM